jgi:hypothetical protein
MPCTVGVLVEEAEAMAEFKTNEPPKAKAPSSPVEAALPEKLSHAELAAKATPPSPQPKPLAADYPTGPVQSPSAPKPEP